MARGREGRALRYNFYWYYFPLCALGRMLRTQTSENSAVSDAARTLQAQGLSARLSQGPELSRAFMVRLDFYRQYFPLAAIGRALRKD